MKKLWVIALMVLLAAPLASAGFYTFNPAFDAGNSDGGTDQWGFICQVGIYQAWLGFDVSAIPDSETIVQAALQGYMFGSGIDTERSCWYDPDDAWITAQTNPDMKGLTELVGTLTQTPADGWYTFNLDLGQHDWQDDLIDDHIALMVSGPTDRDHICGKVYLTESVDFVPVLKVVTEDVVVPVPGALLLAGIGSGLTGWLRRRRSL